MTGTELASMYEFSYGALKRNLEGVTNEESLVIPDAVSYTHLTLPTILLV